MRVHTRHQLIAAAILIFSLLLLPVTSARNSRFEPATGNGSGFTPGGEPPAADLGVTKSAPEEVTPGSNISYQITVINAGPDSADDASLSDPLPPSLTFVSLSAPPGWICMTPAVGAGGTVTCTNAIVAPSLGDVFTLVVNVPVDAMPGTFFTNTATVSTTTFDPNDENNSSSASTLVSGTSLADVAVSKMVDATEAVPGAVLTYTIEVLNSGPDNADNVTLVDLLPAEVNFVSLASPPGWTCMTPAMGANGSVSCSSPTFAVSGDDTFTLMVSVAPGTPSETIITNRATVSTTTAESSEENNSSTATTTVLAPSAANGKVTGSIFDAQGNPVSGAVVRLNGSESRKTITDANGYYQFENVETGGFYTVTPARANYNFNPFNRSFSLAGNQTEAIFTAESVGDNGNPVDTAEYYVRQQYVDILGREPDEAGFNYWSDQILACAENASCTRAQRTGVAAAFFIEKEAQLTGSFIYDVYAGALGRRPAFHEYTTDRAQVVGGDSLDAAKTAFARSFVQRPEFMAKYQNATIADSFVDLLIQSAQSSGGDLNGERANLIGIYNQAGGDLATNRAAVLRALADNAAFKQSQYNKAFVLTEYFAYLRRDIDPAGYDFWVSVLNTGDPGNYRGMVCSFATSMEYQNRFSRIVSHSNGECGQ